MLKHTQIIEARGCACPYIPEKVAQETSSQQAIQAALHESGYLVKSIGGPKAGLNVSDLLHAVDWRRGVNILHLHAHGNIDKNGKHFLQFREDIADRENGRLLAKDLFRWIAARRNGAPINIFLQSCGSGASCEDAIRLLPPGSTVVNMAQEDNISSYSFDAQGYRHTSEPAANAAERLFLNMLCCGMKDAPNQPQVTISQGEAGIENIWTLWDTARHETLEDPDNLQLTVETLDGKLDHLLPQATIRQALATMRLSMQFFMAPVTPVTDPESPVEMPFKADLRGFHQNAAKAGILGPMCAISYVINRDLIGAFQTWPAERYTSKPKRPQANGPFTGLSEPS